MKRIIVIFLSLLLWGCPSASSDIKMESMNLHLGQSNYAELVDFLYDFAGEHRLNILWFGWYRADHARHWYERSNRDSNFKVKLELLAEENGSIFITNRFDESTAFVSVDYGDKKAVWFDVVKSFKKAMVEKGWKMEALKPLHGQAQDNLEGVGH